MKSQSLALLGTMALLTAATAVGQPLLRIDVPFEFSVADRVMPAGSYDVVSTPGLLRVYSHTSRRGVLVTWNYIDAGAKGDTRGRLIFHKYGDQYFLAEAWVSPGSPPGAALSESRTERETARSNSKLARIDVPARTGLPDLDTNR